MNGRRPDVVAAMDQAVADVRQRVAPLGGKVIDTADALFTVVIDRDAVAHISGTTRDYEWIAKSLRLLADEYEQRAREKS